MDFLMLIAILIYLGVLLFAGIIHAKNDSPAKFYLGDRKSDKFVTGLSTQTSGFGGYLFMALPGCIYAFGASKAWLAVGLFLGVVINWAIVPDRLFRYASKNTEIKTLPEYLEYRFDDRMHIIKILSAIVIAITLTIMISCSFVWIGRAFSSITDLSYETAMIICFVVVVVYTMLGGFLAVGITDYIQGLLILIGLFGIPLVAIMLMGKEYVVPNMVHSGLNTSAMEYLNVFRENEDNIPLIEIVSQLSWGLGFCGLPHVVIRFISVKDEKTLVKSRRIALVWSLMVLSLTCIMGVVGRAYLYPMVLKNTNLEYENVYIEMVKKAFLDDVNSPFAAGILLCCVIAAIMAAVDSQLLTGASAIGNDIVKGVVCKKLNDKTQVFIGRICVLIIATIAFCIAHISNIDVNLLFWDCFACLGCFFGPTMILSLYWKKVSTKSAIPGMIVGIVTVLVWNHVKLIEKNSTLVTLNEGTGISSILVGFLAGCIVIIALSLVIKKRSEEAMKRFDDALNKNYESNS